MDIGNYKLLLSHQEALLKKILWRYHDNLSGFYSLIAPVIGSMDILNKENKLKIYILRSGFTQKCLRK